MRTDDFSEISENSDSSSAAPALESDSRNGDALEVVPTDEVLQKVGQIDEKLSAQDARLKEISEQFANSSETEAIEVIDYTQQLNDMAELVSYQSVMLLVMGVALFLIAGINLGSFAFSWFKGR